MNFPKHPIYKQSAHDATKYVVYYAKVNTNSFTLKLFEKYIKNINLRYT